MTSLERRYRRWMVAYPAGYRQEHESEILGTLLQAASRGQDRPSLREVIALLAGGLRTRGRLAAATPGRPWEDGLRLGVLLYVVLACGIGLRISLGPVVFPGRVGIAGDASLVQLQCAVLAIGVVAIARGGYEIGLATLAGFMAIDVIALHGTGVPRPLFQVSWWLVAAVVAALAWHPRLRPLRGPQPWRTVPLALGGAGLVTVFYLAWEGAAMSGLGLGLPLAVASPPLLLPVAVLLLLAVVGADPRPALAATVYVLPQVAGLAQLGFSIPHTGFQEMLYELLLMVSVGAAVTAVAVTVLTARRLARI